MPGGRHPYFRLGDRTELLAEFCLNTIAFTTRVPRQEDIGHDFFCVLVDRREDLLWAGPSFTAQVKSNMEPVVFEKPHELSWVKELENPFFLIVGHRDELRVDIFSTWARLNGVLRQKANRIVFTPGPPSSGREQVWTAPDESEQVIALGEPIVKGTVREFMDEDRAAYLSRVLKQWILVDAENIVNTRVGMHWIIGPGTYRTNEPLDSGSQRIAWIYWNAKNLDRCRINFGRAATALRLTLRRALGEEQERTAQHIEQIRALEAVLVTHREFLDPPTREALRTRVGMEIE